MHAGKARVFFALWPDPGCAERLQRIAARLARDFGGRPMQQSTLHMTLAFVGDVDECRLPELMTIAGLVQAETAHRESQRWVLNRLAYWRHNRILWAGSDATPPTLALLAGQLASGLTASGYAIPERPFLPHVTLVRKMNIEPESNPLCALDESPQPWLYSDFALLRSPRDGQGGGYETLGSWTLHDPETMSIP